MRRAMVGTCLLVVAGLISAVAGAADKDAKYYQGQFDRYSRVIADLKGADANDDLGREIEVIRTWISQSQAFLAADKLEKIDPLIERVAAQAEYVRAKLKRLDAEEAADSAEADADKADGLVTKTKQAADAAEAKYKELEAKGL